MEKNDEQTQNQIRKRRRKLKEQKERMNQVQQKRIELKEQYDKKKVGKPVKNNPSTGIKKFLNKFPLLPKSQTFSKQTLAKRKKINEKIQDAKKKNILQSRKLKIFNEDSYLYNNLKSKQNDTRKLIQQIKSHQEKNTPNKSVDKFKTQLSQKISPISSRIRYRPKFLENQETEDNFEKSIKDYKKIYRYFQKVQLFSTLIMLVISLLLYFIILSRDESKLNLNSSIMITLNYFFYYTVIPYFTFLIVELLQTLLLKSSETWGGYFKMMFQSFLNFASTHRCYNMFCFLSISFIIIYIENNQEKLESNRKKLKTLLIVKIILYSLIFINLIMFSGVKKYTFTFLKDSVTTTASEIYTSSRELSNKGFAAVINAVFLGSITAYLNKLMD